MGLLNREQILESRNRLPSKDVDVPEWGGTVRVRALSGSQRDAFEASIVSSDGKVRKMENVRARICALSIRNEDGGRMFTDEDIIDLGETSAAALDRVFKEAQRLSGFSDSAVEELEKN